MFNENEHPRDSDGKFTDKNGTPAEHKRLVELGVETEQEFVQELHNRLTDTKWEESLSKEEKETVKKYSNFGSVLNRKLWIGEDVDSKFTKLLDNIISTYELKESIEVYRNVPLKQPQETDFHAKGYTSASINKEQVIKNATKSYGIVYLYEVPKGKGNGAYINNLVSESYKNIEYEYLIRRNTKFSFVDKNIKDGIIFITWRVKP